MIFAFLIRTGILAFHPKNPTVCVVVGVDDLIESLIHTWESGALKQGVPLGVGVHCCSGILELPRYMVPQFFLRAVNLVLNASLGYPKLMHDLFARLGVLGSDETLQIRLPTSQLSEQRPQGFLQRVEVLILNLSNGVRLRTACSVSFCSIWLK